MLLRCCYRQTIIGAWQHVTLDLMRVVSHRDLLQRWDDYMSEHELREQRAGASARVIPTPCNARQQLNLEAAGARPGNVEHDLR